MESPAADLRDVPVADPKSHTRVIDTQLIAALAAWLIFNSHLEAYYPRAFMAADGLLGNSLFFLLSGYGIQMSLLGRDQTFVGYFYRRLIRLYPAVILTVLFFEIILAGMWREYGPREHFSKLIYPTRFTYVENIVPFYVLLYAFGRLRSVRAIGIAIALGVAVYVAGCLMNGSLDAAGTWRRELTASHWLSRWAFYWIVVCLGSLLAILGSKSALDRRRLLLLALLLLAYYGVRGFVIITGRMQSLTILVDLLVLPTCMLIFLTFGSPGMVMRVLRVPVIGFFLAASGACTLEIFVIHQSLAGTGHFLPLRFPINILALAVATFLISWGLHHVCEAIRRRCERSVR